MGATIIAGRCNEKWMTVGPANHMPEPAATHPAASRIPYWFGPAALGLILLAIIWFIWWYLYGSLPSQHTVAVDPALVQQATMRAAGRPLPALNTRRTSGVRRTRPVSHGLTVRVVCPTPGT